MDRDGYLHYPQQIPMIELTSIQKMNFSLYLEVCVCEEAAKLNEHGACALLMSG